MADFVLGRLKFKWRGDWATSTAYLIDDIIKYGGNTYVCIVNHTSQSTTANFYTDLSSNSYWQLHSEGLFFKGDWVDATFYKLNDVVKYGGRQYRCTTQHTSSSTLNTGNFQLYTDGLDFKGDWAGSTLYKLNDVVKYGAYQYKTTTEHTSTSTFDPTKFAVYSEGLQWEDNYNAGTTYQDGDVVSYGGYTYVYVNSTPSSGNTPTDNSYWDVITTGYNNTGVYSHGTAYKTGDVVRYGGNSYVANANNTNEYPADNTGATNSSYWDLIVEGFNYRSAYSAVTSYNIGDVVRYESSTYIALKDRFTSVTPGTDGTFWQLIAQGSETAVLSLRGDLLYQDATQAARIPIGVSGAVLTTDGTDPIWSAAEGKNVIYVANSGSDSNDGSQYRPFKSIYHALSVASNGDIVDFNTITGGTGGTSGVYDVSQSATTGSGTGVTARITTDGSSTPTVVITDGGSGHVAGDTVTFPGSSMGSSTDVTINVVSASIGDVIYIKNGVYRETLPLRVPAGVTVQGESLRGTEIRPNSGTGHQTKTVTQSGGGAGTSGTYNYVHQSASSGSGNGIVVNVTQDGSSNPTVTIYHGGYGYVGGDTITIPAANIGNPSTDLTLTVASLENNIASNMFLVNNATNITQMSMKGLTGTPGAGATGKAAVVSLDPEGSITTASPYIQNATSSNANSTGIQIDGNLHSAGNKSILANDFTQINSDGIGVHALARGRGEMVSIFTYYCDKSFYTQSGGFIRGLNCSSAYGEQGAVSDGTDPNESATTVLARGYILKYNTTAFLGGATESDIVSSIAVNGSGTANIVGDTSGATAKLFRYNTSLDYLHIETLVGNFQQGETCTITTESSTTFQITLDSSTGDSSAAQIGQIGPLIAVKSTDGTLGTAGVLQPGSNFTVGANTYRASVISEENTVGQFAVVRLTESVSTLNQIATDTNISVTVNFSNIRLTGHDFLDIGTGDFVTTNYPNTPSQNADQEDEINETNGGRVYYTSTDQKGDFRVGDLFRIQQATGVATLNADAFDLSGLSELQLGSIGAELGATINEFSTDVTLSGDANTAVPTERAVLRYLTQDNAGTGAWVPPTGTTGERPTGGNLYTGGIRYNSSLVTWEGYNGTQWTGLGGGNPWQTQTADGSTAITVAANDRYFIDTTAGAQTANLPASPLVGDQVSFIDITGTFDTNNLTIGRNGNKIMGLEENLIVSTENAGIQLVYTGATNGWRIVNN